MCLWIHPLRKNIKKGVLKTCSGTMRKVNAFHQIMGECAIKYRSKQTWRNQRNPRKLTACCNYATLPGCNIFNKIWGRLHIWYNIINIIRIYSFGKTTFSRGRGGNNVSFNDFFLLCSKWEVFFVDRFHQIQLDGVLQKNINPQYTRY